VPRPNPPRSLQSEENLAHRVVYERERRGWTYEGTAKRLTVAGCPIQGSAIYKIEKGNPRRRISVDELVAFAKVFDVDTSDLLIPPELIAEHEALDAVRELEQKIQVLAAITGECFEAVERIIKLANAVGQEHAQRAVHLLQEKVFSVVEQIIKLSKENEEKLGFLNRGIANMNKPSLFPEVDYPYPIPTLEGWEY
jgi:transcriptional regulator with XRE-family HTH domain